MPMKTKDLAVVGYDRIAPDQPVIGPKRYSLNEMLAVCDLNAPMPVDLAVWDKATIVGAELL